MFLQDFQVIRPKHEIGQETILRWIAKAHDQKELLEKLLKIGLGEKKIQKRGIQISDCLHENWDEMEIYNTKSAPEGYHLDKRMEFFDTHASDIFEKFYPEKAPLPSHLIHVTCTGYVAPSPAQKLVSLREGGKKTQVTHAYHMGCYGSIPSIRMAMGHYMVENKETDIVHTELSSIHMNPNLHTTDQLVVQSLFADGFIKYTLSDGKTHAPKLKILAVQEEVVANSTKKMTWVCNPWGFQMTIAKDIPILLRKNLEEYLERLLEKSGLASWKEARFAIHPGGPKIIEQLADKLELQPEQIRHSQEVLENCGNMSSATLPHVWERMLKDNTVRDGEKIVSLAFGPGLSISGGIFEKWHS